jgi:hypothetical protein
MSEHRLYEDKLSTTAGLSTDQCQVEKQRYACKRLQHRHCSAAHTSETRKNDTFMNKTEKIHHPDSV